MLMHVTGWAVEELGGFWYVNGERGLGERVKPCEAAAFAGLFLVRTPMTSSISPSNKLTTGRNRMALVAALPRAMVKAPAATVAAPVDMRVASPATRTAGAPDRQRRGLACVRL